MILVTGTKRSGTSMWMQLMKAAGLQVIGEAFSRDWEQTIRDANPHGFYESPLRRGIYWATNPSPRTGVYLRSEQVRHVAVKVFIPGVIRTERAYIHRAVSTMRNWREYGASLQRLTTMERENRQALGKRVAEPVTELSPSLDWWRENYMLVRDLAIRQYPLLMVAYDTVLEEPDRSIREVFKWVGVGDADAAISAVDPQVRTQHAPESRPTDVDDATAQVFDDFYGRIRMGKPIDAPFIEVLNETGAQLEPRIQAELREVRRQVAIRRAEAARQRLEQGGGPDDAPPLHAEVDSAEEILQAESMVGGGPDPDA